MTSAGSKVLSYSITLGILFLCRLQIYMDVIMCNRSEYYYQKAVSLSNFFDLIFIPAYGSGKLLTDL